MSEHDAPGWDAIDAALRPLYAGREPLHFGTALSLALGGNAPLQGISAYAVEEPIPHWHFVTFGFTDLYGKESHDPGISGFGFELTFRLRRRGEERPPNWSLNFLQNLGRYVFGSAHSFGAGDHMDLRGPIALEEDTAIRAILVVPDPQLAMPVASPHGSFRFLQVFGIALDELRAVVRWDGIRFAELAASRIPLLVTDLSRQSLLADAGVARAVDEGAVRDGSSTAMLLIKDLSWRKSLFGRPSVTIGASAVEQLREVLRGRLPFGKALGLVGDGGTSVTLEPGENHVRSSDQETVTIALDPDATKALLDALEPRRGSIASSALPAVFHVVPSQILDPHGKVVRVIG